MTKVTALPKREAVLNHLGEIQCSARFSHARIQLKMLEVLVDAALNGEDIESGWHLAEKVYGNEPAFDGSEVFYNRTKSTLSSLRLMLARYYAELSEPPAIWFELPDRGFKLRLVSDEERMEAPSRASILQRWAVWGLCIVIALAFTGLGVWWFAGPRSLPANVSTRDGFPILLDRNGREIISEKWSRLLWNGTNIDPVGQGHQLRSRDILAGMHVKADVVESGSAAADVAVAIATFLPEEPVGGELLLLDGRTAEKIDSLPLPYFHDRQPKPILRFGGEEGDLSADFHLESLSSYDLDGDNRKSELIVCINMADHYPSQLLAIDASDGLTVLRNYWSAGHSNNPMISDINGDGRKEIIISGTNNDFQQAFVAILRPGQPDGRTPIGPRKKVFEEIEGLEENGFLLRFPRTAVGKDPDSRTPRGYARVSEKTSPDGKFVVEVRDVNPVPPRGPDETERIIQFDLSPDLEEVKVNFNADYDFYETEMERLIASGRVVDRWNIMRTGRLEEYEADLATQVEYWDGSEPNPEWRPFTPRDLQRFLER